MLSLFGGLAAAGVGGMGLARAEGPAPAAPALPSSGDLAPALKAGLDKADADFNQVVVRRTVVRRPRRVVHRTVVRRPGRPVVVRRTVVVRRPRRTVVRRRVIYR